MNTKILLASLTTLGLATTAHAAPAGTFQIGAQAQILPVGELRLKAGPLDLDNDTETAFGLMGVADYSITPNLSIAAAPRLLLNVKGDGADESATQLDLAVRLVGHVPVSPKAELFLYGSPAYSFIFPPDEDDEIDSASGLALGIGGGAAFKVSPTVSLVGEVGYTFGFQGTEVNGTDVDLQTDFLHLGVGIQTAI